MTGDFMTIIVSTLVSIFKKKLASLPLIHPRIVAVFFFIWLLKH